MNCERTFKREKYYEERIIINFSQSTTLVLTKIKLHVRHEKFILYFSIFINNELSHFLWYKHWYYIPLCLFQYNLTQFILMKF